MTDSRSPLVEQSLAKPDIHQQWVTAFHSPAMDKFFENAFDYLAYILNAPQNSTILDAGCGNCAHAIRLARRGFFVEAVDFSESVLKAAEANVKANGLEDRIRIRQGNIRALPFKDETFDYIVCWGVLMHIPDIEMALSELTRILTPGGTLIISENNLHCLQSIILRGLKRLRGKEPNGKKTAAGIEHWKDTSVGPLMTRETNIRWLIERFERRGLTVKRRVAGQFTWLYVKVSSPLLKHLIHGFNNFWFKYIKMPHLAYGNIVILQKEKT